MIGKSHNSASKPSNVDLGSEDDFILELQQGRIPRHGVVLTQTTLA